MSRRGRKPAFGESAVVIVCVRLTVSQRADLERVALENQTTMAGVLRDAVDEYVSDYRETRLFEQRH